MSARSDFIEATKAHRAIVIHASNMEHIHFTLRAQRVQELILAGSSVAAAEREVDALDAILGHRSRMNSAIAEAEASRAHLALCAAIFDHEGGL